MIGQTVSHYHVLEALGRGAMGTVYKAHDDRLDRFVALKFLARDLSRDPAANQRFVREAKAASALDHPNICTIYDIDATEDGELFIAMAYYQGETVKDRVARGVLPIPDALDIAVQVADGLMTAHRAGIVHRDIKSPNLIITEDGLVKIVDFGLAKLAGQPHLTKRGIKMGTVSYMSPEQSRGEEADVRSDVWALGVTLYEMMTGQLPFQGGDAAVMLAIEHKAPPSMNSLRDEMPIELDQVVGRAMAKSAEERYQSAADLRSELQRIQEVVEEPLGRVIRLPPRKPRRRPIVLVGLGVVLIAAVLGALSLLPKRVPAPQLSNAVQVTSAIGVEDWPALSPDGHSLAYTSHQSGNSDIWVIQIGVGQSVNRTGDHEGSDTQPSWSPDGRQIAFKSRRNGGGIFLMPALGGTPRRVTSCLGQRGPPQWSPDGRELAHVVQDTTGHFVEIISLSTREIRRLPLPGKLLHRGDLSWSPSGRVFAYMDAATSDSESSLLWVLRIRDGEAFQVANGVAWNWGPSWATDDRALYYVSNRGGGNDLWKQPMAQDGRPHGPPRKLTTGMRMRRACFSQDGSRLAYAGGTGLMGVSNVWRVPILDERPATWEDAQQLTFDDADASFMDISPDGTQLVFDSDRRGNRDIWLIPSEGGPLQQITTDPALDCGPRWSPSGKGIAFYSSRSGNRDIWLMPELFGPVRQLTTDTAADWVLSWSPDGEEIAFTSSRSGTAEIWVKPASGGPARQMMTREGTEFHVDWSPDGDWVAFTSVPPGEWGLWRLSVPGGEIVPVARDGAFLGRFSPDGKKIYFTECLQRGGNIWEMSLEDGTRRRVTDLTGRSGRLGPGCLATDGRFLYLVWCETSRSDIWVMDAEWE